MTRTTPSPSQPETRLGQVDRRSFMAYFSALGLGGTALPGLLWDQAQEQGSLTKEMLAGAEAVTGLEFTDEEREQTLQRVNRNLVSYKALREHPIPNAVHLSGSIRFSREPCCLPSKKSFATQGP